MGNVCCEDRSRLNTGNDGYKDLSKELEFQPWNEEPVISNADIVRRLNELPPIASKIDPKNHPKAQTLMPMKETSRGFIYHGEWINNKPDGFGRVFFPNGEYFEGEFMEGKAKGEGRYFYNNDAFFEGKIDDNKAEGEGRYESKDVSFSGTWEHSKPHVGVFYLSDKTRIEKKDEHRAVIDWPDGRHYEGEIDEELNPSGQGKITFANGNSYEGEWRRGLMNGIGTYKWANGQRYEGFYKNGIKEGQGTFYFSGDERYEGQWRNGRQDGQGKLIKREDVVYEGRFKNGEPSKEEPSPEILQAEKDAWSSEKPVEPAIPSQPEAWKDSGVL